MKKLLILMILLPLVCFGQTRPHITQIQPVNTYDELRAIVPSDNGHWAFVAGRVSANDGGAGDFFWDSTNTTDDDGGSILGSAVSGRWVRMRDDARDYRSGWFASLQEAVAATPAGSRLWVTKNYTSVPQITISKAIEIRGMNTRHLSTDPDSRIVFSGEGFHVLGGSGVRGAVFRDLSIGGPGRSEATAPTLDYTANPKVAGNYGIWYETQETSGHQGLTIENVSLSGFDTGILVEGPWYDGKVINCRINGNNFNIVYTANEVNYSPNSSYITNSKSSGAYGLLHVYRGNVHVVGTRFEESKFRMDNGFSCVNDDFPRSLGIYARGHVTFVGCYLESLTTLAHNSNLKISGGMLAGTNLIAGINSEIDIGRSGVFTTFKAPATYYDQKDTASGIDYAIASEVAGSVLASNRTFDFNKPLILDKSHRGGWTYGHITFKRVSPAAITRMFPRLDSGYLQPDDMVGSYTSFVYPEIRGSRTEAVVPYQLIPHNEWTTLSVYSYNIGVSAIDPGSTVDRLRERWVLSTGDTDVEYHIADRVSGIWHYTDVSPD